MWRGGVVAWPAAATLIQIAPSVSACECMWRVMAGAWHPAAIFTACPRAVRSPGSLWGDFLGDISCMVGHGVLRHGKSGSGCERWGLFWVACWALSPGPSSMFHAWHSAFCGSSTEAGCAGCCFAVMGSLLRGALCCKEVLRRGECVESQTRLRAWGSPRAEGVHTRAAEGALGLAAQAAPPLHPE